MVSYNCALDMAPPWLAVTTLNASRAVPIFDPVCKATRVPTR